jgi:uncharacterized Zn-binding protein involved in type VI secretion
VTKPAARLTDLHVCPLLTPNPHVGGPVTSPGAPTVLIGNLAAARVTDMATCVGPPDAILSGGFTTLIGGLPAARMTDLTVHVGSVVAGFPTVLIGDAPPSVTVVRRGNIFIIVNRDTKTITMVGVQEFSGDGASQAFVDACTAAINSTWSGTTTFEGSPYTVTCMIQGRLHTDGSANNPLANQVIVSKTTMTPSEHKQKDPAHVDGNNVTHIHNNEDDGGTLTVPHEFGHTMGLPDEYTEGPRNPDGTRSITQTGPPNGLMGHINSGAKPTPDNHNSLITGNGLSPK